MCDCIKDGVGSGLVAVGSGERRPLAKADLGAFNVIPSRMYYVNVAAMGEALAGS